MIYASIIAQLLSSRLDVQEPVEKLYKKHGQGKKTPVEGELLEILTTISKPLTIVLAFDALDEAEEDTRETLIKNLATLKSSIFRILVTSRPDVNLFNILTTSRPNVIATENVRTTEIVAHKLDLEIFIQETLKDPKTQKRMGGKPEFVIQQVKDNILSKEDIPRREGL
jgi:hypothetical protein